jgi:hypothetical protein
LTRLFFRALHLNREGRGPSTPAGVTKNNGGYAMEANAQSRASAKWAKKKGLVAKSYKLPLDVVEAFAEACEEKGISQSAQLSKYMIGFIKRAGIDI